MNIFLLILGTTPLFGGPTDRPMIWRLGGNYHTVTTEIYWKGVFEEQGLSFAYDNSPGIYANIDFVVARFKAIEKYRYSAKTHGHLEFTRKTQAFLTPKGLYIGYVAEMYTLSGRAGLGTINTRVTTPGGISIGVFSGELPAYLYFSLNTGASFVSEEWNLNDTTGLGGDPIGNTQSTGFWVIVRGGLFYQIRAYLATDLSLTYSYLNLRHRTGEPIPKAPSLEDTELLQEFRIGLGLIFAMPWKVDKTVW